MRYLCLYFVIIWFSATKAFSVAPADTLSERLISISTAHLNSLMPPCLSPNGPARIIIQPVDNYYPKN